jgi:hypothetical protein
MALAPRPYSPSASFAWYSSINQVSASRPSAEGSASPKGVSILGKVISPRDISLSRRNRSPAAEPSGWRCRKKFLYSVNWCSHGSADPESYASSIDAITGYRLMSARLDAPSHSANLFIASTLSGAPSVLRALPQDSHGRLPTPREPSPTKRSIVLSI